MDIGTIGFKDQKAVIKVPNVERNREIEKRLEKSKTEAFPDFAGEKERHMHELMLERKKKAKEAAKAKKRAVEEARAEKEARSYDKISTFLPCPVRSSTGSDDVPPTDTHVLATVTEDAMKTNADMGGAVDDSAAVDFEEDFM